MEDQELVQRILSGDEIAIETLHRRYAQPLFHYILTQTNDYCDSEELLQDVFYKAATHLGQFKHRSSFKTWIFKIARHTVIDYHRKLATRNAIGIRSLSSQTEFGSYEGADVTVLRYSEVEEINRVIQALPLQYRTVIYLRFIEEFSLKETAKLMGKSIYSVKSLQKRAQKMIGKNVQMEVPTHEKRGFPY